MTRDRLEHTDVCMSGAQEMKWMYARDHAWPDHSMALGMRRFHQMKPNTDLGMSSKYRMTFSIPIVIIVDTDWSILNVGESQS